MNLVVAEEGGVEDEQEGEEVYNDTNPYAYNLNEIQGEEEGVPLGRYLVIQRLLLTPRMDYSDQLNSERVSPSVKGLVI